MVLILLCDYSCAIVLGFSILIINYIKLIYYKYINVGILHYNPKLCCFLSSPSSCRLAIMELQVCFRVHVKIVVCWLIVNAGCPCGVSRGLSSTNWVWICTPSYSEKVASTSTKRTLCFMGLKSHDLIDMILLAIFISHIIPSQCINKLSEGWIWSFAQYNNPQGLIFVSKIFSKVYNLVSSSNGLCIAVRLSQIPLNSFMYLSTDFNLILIL